MRPLADTNPTFVFDQVRGIKFFMEQPLIPPIYKHLIMVAVACAVVSMMCKTVS